jgi:carbon storage regulator
MLVLSRKLGERFQIGPDVRVTVVKLDKNTVRIGIEAPDDMPIHREEVTPRAATASPKNVGVPVVEFARNR